MNGGDGMDEVTITPEMIRDAIAEVTRPGGEFDTGTKVINGTEVRVFLNIPKTLPEFYKSHCNEFADLDFLVWYDERYTFAEVYQQAAVVANLLKDRFGIEKGDRVAIASRNYPEWVVALMAITSIGAIAVGINSWWQAEELQYGLEDSGAKVLFADQQRADRLRGRFEALGVQVIVKRPEGERIAGTISFDEFIADGENKDMPEVELDTDDDALIMYTSGSTGHPKGSISSHRNVLTGVYTWKLTTEAGGILMPPPEEPPPGVPEIPAVLLNVPLFHVTGCYAQLLLSLIFGRKVVMMYKWDTEEALQLIEKERITTFNGPGTMDWDLMESPSFGKVDLRSVTLVGGGGAPRPAENVLRIDRVFPNASPNIGWGMTETNAIGSGVAGEPYISRPNCSGWPDYIVDFRIVDEDGNDLPQGEAGEIWVRGASITRGYWNKPEATAETITDGWLHTGDVGYFDEDGFLYISDRIKDMILRGGENVYCAEIESVLYDHPSVLEATVFGVPDTRLGEVPAAMILPRENTTLTEQEVQDYVGSRLAAFKVPEFVWFSEEPLLRNAAEKIFKRQIREEIVRTHFGDSENP
jgi:long-chain acyl-CoA synthetase